MVVKVLFVVGARPNFVKVAPVILRSSSLERAVQTGVRFEIVLVPTGQHYDELLSGVFFRQLGLPEPDQHLGIGSGTQAWQTARMLEALEPVVCRHKPDAVFEAMSTPPAPALSWRQN